MNETIGDRMRAAGMEVDDPSLAEVLDVLGLPDDVGAIAAYVDAHQLPAPIEQALIDAGRLAPRLR
jgi:hypothetical protein